MRVKICGITQPGQGQAIANMGATALGFMCVSWSPRYIVPEQIYRIVESLPLQPLTGKPVDRVGVFADASIEEIVQVVAVGRLNVVQLHGSESPQFCHQLRAALPDVEIIRALRIRDADGLKQALIYENEVDTLLLDAYHPHLLGGTGKTLDWSSLREFSPKIPWLLAGGLNPENIGNALSQLAPDGIDLSSGVEHAPGNKDLQKVAQLFSALQQKVVLKK